MSTETAVDPRIAKSNDALRTPMGEFWRKFKKQPVAMAAAGFVFFLIIVAIVGPMITPFDPDFSCEIAVTEGQSAMAVQEEDAKAFVSLMRLAPNGIYRRNIKMNGFVVVSSNMGVVRTEEDYIMVAVSPRSSVASLQEDTKSRFALLAETFGFEIEYSGEYPGWSYAEESKIRDLFVESYRDLFGSELRLEAIHAGLECGLFSEAIPGLDAIAVGPTLNNVHTPDENAPLDSLERFYELLKDVLSRLARA